MQCLQLFLGGTRKLSETLHYMDDNYSKCILMKSNPYKFNKIYIYEIDIFRRIIFYETAWITFIFLEKSKEYWAL